MLDITVGYREVIPDQSILDPWKEISVNTGGTQGTLQDIKVSERANGFCYRDSTKYYTRNRFIYWRISHDVLELVEYSLDINLAGNRIRYKFVDTPILDGVSIHESYDNVIVLVPTVCSVHRLVFPHPQKYHRQDDVMYPDLAAPSVFTEATVSEARDPSTFYCFPNSSSQLPYLADSLLTLADEEATFVLAYPSSEILLVKQSSTGKIESFVLKSESIVPKFLSGLADKLRQRDKEGETTVSLLLYQFRLETFVLTLTRNGQLKFWNCTKGECVAVTDDLAETGDYKLNKIQGTQNHILRKAVDYYDSDECFIGVFMSYANDSHIHVLKPYFESSHIKVARITTLYVDQNDLIDFTLTNSRIWSVWRGKDGDCEVYWASLSEKTRWMPVVLEEVPDASQPPNVDGETEPRQLYLQYIFQPGRFPLHIISKALNIFKRSAVLGDVNLSTANLKQQICMAVEEEIQSELKETFVSDEDYLECGHYCWHRFYSCCVQYHIAGLKPLGLLLLPNSSGAVLVKKSMISLLRPLDVLEHFVYENDYIITEQFYKYFLLNIDITNDVITIFKVINYLERQTNELFSYTFERELAMLKSPDVIMSLLLEKIETEMDREFTDYVGESLSSCSDLYQAIHKVLELLRIDPVLPVKDDEETKVSISQIFTSHLGVSFVSKCLRQQAKNKFRICRNLLFITNILLRRRELDWNILESIRSVCTPEITILTQANYVMVWLTGLPALTHLPSESSLQRLSILKLTPVFNLRNNSLHVISLIEMFVGSTGGYEARKAFARIRLDEDALPQWQMSLLSYLNCLYHLIWPIGGEATLSQWLLSSGQHLWLQQFVRQINTWCEWNSSTSNFLLAVSLLATGEAYKSITLFKLAVTGLFTEPFLAQRLTSNEQPPKAYINYYLKVIHLFELYKAYDCAIEVSNTALSIATPGDPLIATLYSIKFKHHLALKNYTMAYDALYSNPDVDRRNDSLRDLVKKLLDEKQLNLLLSFTYGDLETQFCEMIAARARATDAMNNIYYEFLYAYQVKRGPLYFRLAATAMYEKAYRLKEYDDIDALAQQVNCLLAAHNVLSLCSAEYSYIVMPNDSVASDTVTKRDDKERTAMEIDKSNATASMKMINLEILSKELLFARTKLQLIKVNPRNYFEITNPEELVTLLNQSGLYKTGLRVAKAFSLQYASIFESLTKRCGSLLYNHDQSEFGWLTHNELQDVKGNLDDAASVAWDLLRDLIEEYEEEHLSSIHQVVCAQIVGMRMWIPQWLLVSYKKRNPAELFRLVLNAGRLEEAAEIAKEYIMAALGYGKENYGFSLAIQATAPPVYLPVRQFIKLLSYMEVINMENPVKPLLKEHMELSEVLNNYLKLSQRVSDEMCRFQLHA